MKPFTIHEALACPLPLANIDTDQIIAARFMSRPRKEGYGDVLLYGHRFHEDGSIKPDCPLNQPLHAGASALVTLRNFGTGSSREAAVYALVDYGMRCVIAPSFGDIFASNAVNNGLLPAVVSEATAERLLALTAQAPALRIDLEACQIHAGGEVFTFALDPVWRMKLLNGWDDLDLTASYSHEIAAFQQRDLAIRPWVVPHRS